MIRYRVSELTGALLDAAVAKALGEQFLTTPASCQVLKRRSTVTINLRQPSERPITTEVFERYSPSTDKALAMEILWHDKMLIGPPLSSGYLYDSWGTEAPPAVYKDGQWWARAHGTKRNEYGPDPLIAICRAKVASHFGEFVELP